MTTDNLVDEWVGHNLLTSDPELLARIKAAADCVDAAWRNGRP